jgi:hypothetical protein
MAPQMIHPLCKRKNMPGDIEVKKLIKMEGAAK